VAHYSSRDFKLGKITVRNGELPNKPVGGLWASPVGAEFSWQDWREAKGFRDVSEQHRVILDINLENFIIIDNVRDLDKLPWSCIEGTDIEAIDFEGLVRRGVDGIYLTEKGQYETRFPLRATFWRNLYGWDCECVLILNERCIKGVGEEGMMCEPRPKENIINLMAEDFKKKNRKGKREQVSLVQKAFRKGKAAAGLKD